MPEAIPSPDHLQGQLVYYLNPFLLGADSSGPEYRDFSRTLWIAAALLLLRWTLDHTVVPRIESWLARHGKKSLAMKFFNDAYIVVWAVGTEVFAIFVMLYANGECKPWNTRTCYVGWPHHELNMLQRWYMLLMFQGYLHEFVGGFIGVGPPLRVDMLIHHVATMSLISSAYLLNVSQMGIMWQALFDISNPLLHAAKMMNTLGFPQTESIKWYIFALFAVTFFVARIAMAPFAIVWPTLTQSTKVMPPKFSALPISMMVVVCGIQWLWFYKIVRLATGADKEPKEKAQ